MERQTRQRHAVMQALHTSGRSLSPAEIMSLAQRQVPTLSLSTVYRQLKSLVAEGQVVPVELPGLPPRFETPPTAPGVAAAGVASPAQPHDHGHDHHHEASAGQAPHRHHVHCTACDQVFPIHGCPGGIERLVPPGWTVERHDLTLHGRCPACTSGGATR